MSKQSECQQLSSEVPWTHEYGFAARLPQAGRSCRANGACRAKGACRARRAYHAPCQSSGTGYEHMAYPAAAYAGAPVTGYPVMMTPMAGPVGMVVLDPLEKREMKQAWRPVKAGGCRRRRMCPVGLLVGLVRSALQSSRGQR